MADELEHAFAVTIHKSQGSEYPAVVIPLLSGPRMLMNRNLLYTAVTRARRMVVLIGNPDVMNAMIDNGTQEKRYTSLDLYLRQEAAKDGREALPADDSSDAGQADPDDPLAAYAFDPGQIDPEDPFSALS